MKTKKTKNTAQKTKRMSNSDATKNKVITGEWRFLVVTLNIICHAIIVGKKTVKLFHMRVPVIIMPTLTLSVLI